MDSYSNPYGYEASVGRPAWIMKTAHPPIEALLYGSWGWSTDGNETSAHIVFHPDMETDATRVVADDGQSWLTCEFRDHNNVTVTGQDMPVPWCNWKINYENTQLVLSVPDETEGLTGGFIDPELTNSWMNRDAVAEDPSDE